VAHYSKPGKCLRHLLLPLWVSVIAALGMIGAARAAGHQPGIDDEDYVPLVFITGSNRGIGLEFVRQYVARGWRVIATARHPERAVKLKALAADHPGLVTIERLDVLDFAAIDALAAKYADTPIDILINNAGITGGAASQRLGQMEFDVFDKVLRVNVIGPLKISEAFLDHVAASREKQIVTVTSSQGSIGMVKSPRLYFYRSSKAAVNMVMKNLALDVKSRGVIVTLVNPGPTDTDMMAGVPKKWLRKTEVAVGDMIRIIDRQTIDTTGKFWHYNGKQLPW